MSSNGLISTEYARDRTGYPLLPFRVLAWNIRAGGGRRIDAITDAIDELSPDLLVLSEFRATPPSQQLAQRLRRMGYAFQHTTTAQVKLGANALLIASKMAQRRVGLRQYPREPGRWNMVRLIGPGLSIGGLHIPNQHTGRKPQFHEATLAIMQRWRGGPAIILGDTNSGQIGIDEERPVFTQRTHQWFEHIQATGWRDAFRVLHGNRREYTWYSPGYDNGFRLDQAFVSPELGSRLVNVQHIWVQHPDAPGRRDAVSDHAALVLDLDLGGLG